MAGNTVASAYVQIVPSAEGIKDSIGKALGGSAKSAGESAGGQLVGAIKGVIAAAGIGAALTKTITEGAALEQSIGGVETLFKESADTIKQYTQDAYTTAGVSANSYMEQVTSFSATLLQGLGGDTAAAAESANKAIVQMADNANKMGTDIGSIQWAYQGFAKDNYTMLDNLKLGYGGTQSEMARLINDSGVLGDSIEVTAQTVKDVPFDKIIDAIGVIQDNLGITGTTAKEAATTLSGSFASMQAAASNVMGALTLGQDLQPALQGLASTVSTFLVGNLLPAIWNVLSALPSALVTFVQSLAPQLLPGLQSFLQQVTASITTGLPQLLQGITSGFNAYFPQLVAVGAEFLQNIGTGLAQGIPNFLAQALPMVLSFTDTLRANFGTIIDAGIDMLLNLAQGIADAMPTLIEYIPQIVSNIAGLINDNAPKILQAGIQIIITLVSGLIQSIPTIVANIPQIIQAIVDVITAFNWLNLGATIIKGIGNGLLSMAGGLKTMMESTFSGAVDIIKSLPGKALQWGKDMIQGFINGIIGSIGGVVKAVGSVASAIAEYLHFSRPDLGPLRYYEQWMPDMMQGMAGGITANIRTVTTALDSLGDAMSSTMQRGLLDDLSGLPAQQLRTSLESAAATSPQLSPASDTSPSFELINAIFTAAAQIVAAVQENGGDIVIGDDVIGRANARYQADQAIVTGGAVF